MCVLSFRCACIGVRDDMRKEERRRRDPGKTFELVASGAQLTAHTCTMRIPHKGKCQVHIALYANVMSLTSALHYYITIPRRDILKYSVNGASEREEGNVNRGPERDAMNEGKRLTRLTWALCALRSWVVPQSERGLAADDGAATSYFFAGDGGACSHSAVHILRYSLSILCCVIVVCVRVVEII